MTRITISYERLTIVRESDEQREPDPIDVEFERLPALLEKPARPKLGAAVRAMIALRTRAA